MPTQPSPGAAQNPAPKRNASSFKAGPASPASPPASSKQQQQQQEAKKAD
ncbi:hypothetical protein DFH27DRAFT_615716 [Peziza echinospora]|nr:hypothetical protein DFH27DRAFT_615716 [Peziza echinospora]